MHELITRGLYYLQVHLLYASIVWIAAWSLTSTLRGSATTKYWIWVATSFNFVFPLGALLDRYWTSLLLPASPLGVIGDMAGSISRSPAASVLFGVWLAGATLMSTRLYLRVRAERRNTQKASRRDPMIVAHGVPVRFAASRQGPAANGVLRTHISLPDGIERLLSEHELNAVLIHEVTHARRRDNLIRLIHEAGLCVLWFHPFLWMTGSRLSLYRELSCDESVIQNAHGGDLVSALAKLANPEETFLLQSTASSFLSHRLARLIAAPPQRARRAASILLSLMFSAVLLWGFFGTVTHTACCFITRK